MKSFKLLTFFAFLVLLTTTMIGQSTGNYKVTRHVDNVWTILESSDNGNVNIYVVEGKDSALVIDTGFGTGDIKEFIQTLTRLPLVIVNTHGHGDHAGGDKLFSKVYLHPHDFYMVNANFKEIQKDKPMNLESTAFIPVREGHVFDLGNRKLEVIEVPGHTHGSIVLLDKENKILFAGDHTNSLVWLFLKDCYPLEVYLKSLEKVQKMVDNFNIIMPGHNTPLEKTFISEQIGCVKTILDGTCSATHYDHPANNSRALVCKYKTAQVAYDPKNLRVTK